MNREVGERRVVDGRANGGFLVRGPRLAAVGIAAFAVTFALARWREQEPPTEAVAATPSHADAATSTQPAETPPGMAWVPGGEFVMGTDDPRAWPDERPARRVRVDGFWIDVREVSNAEFRRFVEATNYVTTAERPPDVEEILRQSPPGTSPPSKEMLVPGALVFSPPDQPVPLDDVSRWWKWTPGACWKHPDGPGSTIEGKDGHPVVQVSWDDAVAYARWAGKRLPTEAEWERAARGGAEGKPYVWGDTPPSEESVFANIWQGHFPDRNSARDGFPRTAPTGTFAPNGYGLYDMAGNVWEWCADVYRDDPSRGPLLRSQRGGSFLCNDDFCSRYRPSARHGCTPDTGMSHVGFRCVRSPGAAAPSETPLRTATE